MSPPSVTMRPPSTSSSLSLASLAILVLLLRCGDVEANPGPPRRSVGGKAPTADEKIEALSTALAQYEAKVSGLESELDAHRKAYDDKIKGDMT